MKLLLIFLLSISAAAAQATSVNIKILSSMLASRGFGEWGFAALVEVDGKRILFDTGAHPETVLRNLHELNLNLSDITDVVLSHNHLDHTAGLMTLRKEMMAKNKSALSVAHAGKGIFLSRRSRDGKETNPMIEIRKMYEASGAKIIEHNAPTQIAKNVWLTGPVPRPNPEKNYGRGLVLTHEDGKTEEDFLPEDISLVIDTTKGLVVLAGCGHSGIVNTLEHVRAKIKNSAIYAVIGGFHLFALSDEQLDWTADKLKQMGTQLFLGAHCTGIEATFRIRQRMGLTRKSAAVASVGGGFSLDQGIDPGLIAR